MSTLPLERANALPPASARRSSRLLVVGAFLSTMAVLVALLSSQAVPASGATLPPTGSTSLLAGANPSRLSLVDDDSVELGVRFEAASAGRLTGLRIYRVSGDGGRRATLWSSGGTALASVSFPTAEGAGWQYAAFATPVSVTSGTEYVASYHANSGYLAETAYFTSRPSPAGPLTFGAEPSRFSYGSTSVMPTKTWRGTNYWIDPVVTTTTVAAPVPTQPSATPTAAPKPTATPTAPATTTPASSYPNANNTGVPAGVTLTDYTGPMTVTAANAVIDAKRIRGRLVIAASNVTIKRSSVTGNIDADSSVASVRVEDSDVDAGTAHVAAIGYSNVTVVRTEVRGGQHSVLCGTNCVVRNSWLHAQYLPSNEDWHNQAYLSSGGHNVELSGNTFECTPRDNSVGGGCTADVAFFGDFSAVYDVTVSGNLFKGTPGGFCGTFGYNAGKPYGTQAREITITDNVFELGSGGKCGYWGPVTGVPTGSVFTNNRFTDGRSIAAAR